MRGTLGCGPERHPTTLAAPHIERGSVRLEYNFRQTACGWRSRISHVMLVALGMPALGLRTKTSEHRRRFGLSNDETTMKIATEIEIEASTERVWRILTDTARYGEWNSFIPALQGSLQPGHRISFQLSLPIGLRIPAQAMVLAATAQRELRWAGVLGWAWLFRAEHYHLLEPRSGRVHFRHGERFSGLFAVLAWPLLRLFVPAQYHAVNRNLKSRAESESLSAPTTSLAEI